MKKIAILLTLVFTLFVFAGCVVRVPSGSVGSDGKIPDTSKFIGEERAKQIAIERAGIPSDGANFVRVELDRDNGIWKYEVEFRQGRTEYDADIKDITERLIDVSWNYQKNEEVKQYISKLTVLTNGLKTNLLDIVTKATQRGVIVSSISELNRNGSIYYDLLVKVKNKN